MHTQDYRIRLIHADQSVEYRPMTCTAQEDHLHLTFPMAEVGADVVRVEVLQDLFDAKEGMEGYYVVPERWQGSFLCSFKHREDAEFSTSGYNMPLLGARIGEQAILLVYSSNSWNYALNVGVKDGAYSAYGSIDTRLHPVFEDITVELFVLEGRDADYSGMARAYRRYQLRDGRIRPLSEKAQEREELSYAVDSVEIRIRMGWKPVPPDVIYQTRETEPPMHVAMTFSKVETLIAELKKQGVKKAELCLVGWNVSGHDGRWPEMLPVEEAFGGEEGLRHLIHTAEEAGYRIVCHTNVSDAYTIADTWDEETIIRTADGQLEDNPTAYSGGKMFHVCPKATLDQYKKAMDAIRELGFHGIHYIDVISIVTPRTCFHPQHPMNSRECADLWRELMRDAKEKIGGIASEGGSDYCAEDLDFALYVSHSYQNALSLCDRVIPLWQLVYHGLVLSNPFGTSFNLPAKDPVERLKFFEFGGRPVIYYYRKFTASALKNAEPDYLCDTPEQLVNGVTGIRKWMDEYEELKRLQYLYMDAHDEIAPAVFQTRYSDGTTMICNYSEEPYTIHNESVLPLTYRVFDGT